MEASRILSIFSLVCAAASSAAGAGGPKAKVSVTNAEVAVDGMLTETCWQREADFADFKLLASGKSATQQTEAWVARDDTWLYVGFKCYDSAADRIACRVTERDASVHQDEWVELQSDAKPSHSRAWGQPLWGAVTRDVPVPPPTEGATQ